MRIILEETASDPRIFNVLIDFTGYTQPGKYFPVLHNGKWYERVENKVPTATLDTILVELKLRRIHWWTSARPSTYYRRTNIYRTTVISEREL
jgi:hypothetical protein